MATALHSPTGLAHPVPYHHVALSTGSTTVTIAGQTGGSIGNRTPQPGDLATQVAQALRNISLALQSAHADFTDVTRLTMYVTDWHPDNMPELLNGIDAVRAELNIPDPLPPSSLIGVQVLFEPGVLVEIEATAITD